MSALFPELDTPALVVDLAVMEANLERMAAEARRRGVRLRPHTKTHKAPWIAKRQLEYGASGITVAKLGEAEVMVAAGIRDILVAYPIVGERKLERLAALAADADVKVSLDSVEAAYGVSAVGRRIGRRVPIYLEIDTGLGRVGVLPGQEAVELARAIARLPGVEIVAVTSHGGHVGAAESEEALEAASRAQARVLVETAEALRAAGIGVVGVSPGSTLTARFDLDTPGVTEIRPGTYVFNDANTVRRWSASLETCAAFVVATVVSRPASDRAVVDAGSKTFSSDRPVGGDEHGYGIVKGRPGLVLARLTEEHGMLRVTGAASDLRIGDRLAIVPNHICTAVNLADVLYGVRDGRVVSEIAVAGRGKRT